MKVLGADLIAFWQEWPGGDDIYLEQGPIFTDEAGVLRYGYEEDDEGQQPILPGEKYDIEGVRGWQGKTPRPFDFDPDLARCIQRWRKARTTTTVVVEVPKARAEEVRAVLRGLGLNPQ